MLNGRFVIDAVAHSFNLAEDNFAFPPHAAPLTDMVYGVVSLAPEGYRLEREAVLRDWDPVDTAALLFNESATDAAVFHPTPIMAYKDGMTSPEKAQDAVTRWPKRFIGAYAAVDPMAGKAAFDDLDRQIEMLDPVGLKLYPTHWGADGFAMWRMDDPKVAYPLFEAAAEKGIKTIAVHKAIPLGPSPTWPSFDPTDVEGAADAYPELNFEIVHGGAAFTEETAWLMGRFPNIYINMESLNIILVNRPRTFAKIMLGLMHVGGAGVLDRMFWGSGTMQYHPQPCLDAFDAFEFPEDLLEDYGLFSAIEQITGEQKAGILGENYARMHGFDIEAIKADIADDEFSWDPDNRPSPYSTTTIADAVLPAAGPADAPMPAGAP